MFNYYGQSLNALIGKLRENENITESEWQLYALQNGLFSAESLMWIYAETEEWKYFIEKLKNERSIWKINRINKRFSDNFLPQWRGINMQKKII